MNEKIQAVIVEVGSELARAMNAHGPMFNAMEGYMVIHEEFDELWVDVMRHDKSPSEAKRKMRMEAIQVAAMGVRFVTNVISHENGNSPRVTQILTLLENEVLRAVHKHATPWHGAHEGAGYIRQWLEKLWNEVIHIDGVRDPTLSVMQRRAIQVSACAVRFVIDACDK